MSTSKSRTADKFVVRLPDGMRDEIAKIADKKIRSMNSEIVSRLEHYGEMENALENEKALVRILVKRIRELEAKLGIDE
jgi:hypothetical protein